MDIKMLQILLILSLQFCLTPAARILLLPFAFNSHVSEIYHIGQSLMDRGHDVHMVLSPSLPDFDRFKKKSIPIITHHLVEKDFYSLPQDDLDEMWETMMRMTLVDDLRTNVEGYTEMCTNPLSDEALIKKLGSMNFDLAVVDTFVCSRCLLLIPYRLRIPFVNLVTDFEPWLLRNPALPSFVPFNMYGSKSTDMNFWERLDNTYRIVEWTMFPNVPYLEEEYLEPYFGNKPPITINQLAGQALLWLLDTDLALDYPRPIMPNEVLIGGLTTRKGNPLSKELEQFMNQHTKGVIVVSFGSMAANLPEEARLKLMETFKKVDYGVIWRYPVTTPVAPHIKLLKWLPQQDLLSHPKTKLFITHCGANGQFEGLYHAVPMIGMPLFAEQHYNSKRAEYKGFGKTVDILDFTVDELLNTINETINNNSYHENIQKASRIFKSAQMSPSDRATWWIEHVINNGGHHLRVHALDMPWYQYLMLDILLFVSGIALVFSFVVIKLVCKCSKAMTKQINAGLDKNNIKLKNN